MNELEGLIDEVQDLKKNHLHTLTQRVESLDLRVMKVEVKLGYGLWGVGVIAAAAVVRTVQGFF